ncbi:MAG: hypothetical protein QOG74_3188, partial [Alphaproteobacteria bacterium]|nr:hypothetical protein [Alphaproteobacteria bacterium]
ACASLSPTEEDEQSDNEACLLKVPARTPRR